MTEKSRFLFGAVFCAFISTTAFAQKVHHQWNEINRSAAVSVDSTTKNGYTLIFVNNDAAFSKQTEQRMIQTFFEVYPREAKAYNLHTRKKVFLVIDPEYKAVAATAGNVIRVNPEWMTQHPEDLDVVTHEAMHIVQAYHGNTGPGWITEGIADYVRYEFGVNNSAGGWSLTPFKASQSYTDAYRITARFFVWISENYDKHFVRKLDAAMRNHGYSNAFWKSETNKTLDELWAKYAQNPKI